LVAQQNKFAAFFSRFSNTVESFSKLPITPFRHLTAEESQVISAEADLPPEDVLHNELLKQRRLHNSRASRFQAEAQNIHSKRNADSHDSARDLSEHSSDAAFLASQDSSAPSELHPRFALARELINRSAPLVHKVSENTNQSASAKLKDEPRKSARGHTSAPPVGYCSQGHIINARVQIKEGRTAKCKFCNLSFKSDMYFCYCNQYACILCLRQQKTAPPPPSCPNLQCLGRCSQRSRPLTQKCYSCKRDISPRTHFWQCPEKKCSLMICAHCAKPHFNTALLSADSLHHPPPHNACSSTSAPNSEGLSAPMQNQQRP
jgi:hypothetical protein